MKNRFRKNQVKAGLKRPKTPHSSDIDRGVKKNRVTKNKFNDNPPPTPSSSNESSEKEQLSASASEHEKDDEVFSYRESSAYDNLVDRLKPCNNVDDNDSESMSDEGQGSDGEHAGSGDESELNDPLDEAGNTKYSDEENDSDEDVDLEVNSQCANGSSLATSSYNDHFGYNLADGATDNLEKRRLKYKWELPALGKSNCRWMGTGECFLKEAEMNSGCGLKPKLYDNWLDVYKKSGGTDFDSSMQRYFFCLFNSYWDILHYNKKPFYLKGQEEDSSVMDAYIMHSLNHVFRTSELVRKNDMKIGKHLETGKGEILTGDGFLDRGFTRPKVLILLPTASIALRVVRRLIQLTPATHKVNIEHLDRFYDDFGTGVVEENVDDESSRNSSKPSDFQTLFSGNNNDHFMIGIKFTRKSIKLYSDFYSSDFIIASPLGLITKIGEAEIEKERDVDYLSSIEVLIIDHADVIAMQNWSHVNTVVDQLNRIPSKQHGTDVMCIRKWYLDGHAHFYRQTILLGSYLNPDMNALFNHWCHNYKGKVKLSYEYKGVLPKVLLQVRQLYERFNSDSIVEADDARLEYFAEKVYPKLKESNQGGTMLFISSYFEFVRVRNFLKAQNASFCLLGEYTKQSDISRARVWFFEGKRKIMLYTERAHFYHRYKIRGIQNLIMYSLPERKEFYPEIVNMLDGSHNMNCTVLFSRFDQLRMSCSNLTSFNIFPVTVSWRELLELLRQKGWLHQIRECLSSVSCSDTTSEFGRLKPCVGEKELNSY